ncbi:AMP-binding protein [Capillimicrobium parvum]|uniref:Long-chain-fatty-acid--CoA ligase FadD13 n=1 Tax=Capillimicrobium parvum TaxID=2884022 RepID=A0A9E6Y1I4_9ACTN|nr:AMP-binding protein [Capillimicrobium parvum]UGS38215.1 Long-chain-fatty-acid--CoA ligase FadD13 [Capillimicrobium parvum]
MNVATLLQKAAATHPDGPAIVQADVTTTYDDWWCRVQRLAATLVERGVAPGDRVSLALFNSPAFLDTLFATWLAGGVVVPINTRLHPRELAYMVEHSDSRVLVYDHRLADGVAAVDLPDTTATMIVGGPSDEYEAVVASGPVFGVPVARGGDDLAWLFYTSGTTGRPKGAMVTCANLAFMAGRYTAEVTPVEPGDRVLHAGPLTHGSGLWALPLTAAGATHVLPSSPSFDAAELFGLIERHRVSNLVFISPTMLKMLLEAPEATSADCASLRFAAYGGAPIHPDDLRAAMDAWGPILCNLYGQGECPMTISMLTPSDHAEARATASRRLLSAGRPRAGIEVAVMDDAGGPVQTGETGEVCVRGPVVMRGYWSNAQATADAFRDGWYRTGDLGTLDEDGYLYLGDRLKELIISGGSNVYPRELEDVIGRLEGVREVAVVGVADRHWGESVVAVVVPTAPGAVTAEQVVGACRAELASYKKPRHVVFADRLPRSAYGKVLKRELTAELDLPDG